LEVFMKSLLAAALIAGAGMFAAAASQAMTLAPAHLPGTPPIIKVIQGCGPNGHRGPGGDCRPRFSCPRGWHSGPQGWHCFRDH
jgi:hypothetical protein